MLLSLDYAHCTFIYFLIDCWFILTPNTLRIFEATFLSKKPKTKHLLF